MARSRQADAAADAGPTRKAGEEPTRRRQRRERTQTRERTPRSGSCGSTSPARRRSRSRRSPTSSSSAKSTSPGRYQIEVIDLLENPQLAAGDQIVAIPTLVRKLPEPLRKIVGDLSNTERTLVGLQLRPATSANR